MFFASCNWCNLLNWAPAYRLWLSTDSSVIALRRHLVVIFVQLIIAVRLLEELEESLWLCDTMGRCRSNSPLVHIGCGWQVRLVIGSRKVPGFLFVVCLWDWRHNASIHRILLVIGLVVDHEAIRSDIIAPQWNKCILLPFSQVWGATSKTIRCLSRWVVSELAEDEHFVFRQVGRGAFNPLDPH